MSEEYIVVSPTKIIIKEDTPRFRKDMGKIKELAESFKKFGQLQPCLVNRNMELIAGGRRLAACVEAGIDVKIVFTDTVDPLVMREMELEENIQRKAFTPAEEILAIDELHRLKRQIYGEPVVGSDKKTGWTQQDTADIIGKSRDSVTKNLELAEALKNFPILAACKSKSDIKKAVKGLQRIQDSAEALATHEEFIKERGTLYEFHNIDCLEHLSTMAEKSVDILLTDPPYGIDIHDITIGLGGHTGSTVTTTGIKYDDDYQNAMELIGKVAIESHRIVKDTGFAVVFCAISNFPMVRMLFESAGWFCSQRPVIWIKNESGQNNAPSKWFSAAYEAMLFARRVDSQIVIEGKVDWIQCPNVTPSVRIHQAEKPVALLKELLSRLGMAGSVVLDPFAGSGATIEASLELNMFPIGCEQLAEAYALAQARIVNYLKTRS